MQLSKLFLAVGLATASLVTTVCAWNDRYDQFPPAISPSSPSTPAPAITKQPCSSSVKVSPRMDLSGAWTSPLGTTSIHSCRTFSSSIHRPSSSLAQRSMCRYIMARRSSIIRCLLSAEISACSGLMDGGKCAFFPSTLKIKC